MNTSDFGIGALIGALLPLLIGVVERPNWPNGVRSGVALGICLAAAVVSSLFVGGVDFRDPSFDLVAWAGTIWASAMVSYARFWKPTGTVPAIERSTSPG